MITSVVIKKFKVIDYLRMDGLTSVNIISGNNNSGKSSILEAMFLFYDSLNPLMPIRDASLRGVSISINDGSDPFNHLFYKYDRGQEISIEVTDRFRNVMLLKIDTTFQNYNYTATSNINESTGKDLNVGGASIERMKMQITSNSANVLTGYFQINFNQISLNIVNNTFEENKKVTFVSSKSMPNSTEDARRYSSISLRGEEEALINAIRKFDPSITDIRIQFNLGGPYLSAKKLDGTEMQLNLFGGGSQRLIEILLAIADTRNGLVLIDEIENGFHYSRFDQVWNTIYEFARTYNCQLFVVSHSYECIQSAYEASNSEQIRPTFVRVLHKERVEAKIYKYELAKVALANSVELR